MSARRIIVTGGCGYVGSALYRYLAARDYQVLSVDFLARGNPGDVPNIKVDYCWLHPEHVGSEGFSGFDAVVHLAADATVQECGERPLQAFYNNLVQPVNFVDRLKKGQTFIYASTGSLHSSNGVTSVYDYTKRSLEHAMAHFYPQAVGLRFGTVCGPSPNSRRTMLNAMVDDALTTGRITVSNPHVKRPILGIGDLCRAVEQMIEAPQPGVHDLCSFSGYVKRFAKTIATELPVEIEYGPDSPTYDFDMGCADWFMPLESEGSVIEALIDEHHAKRRAAAAVAEESV